MECNNFKKIIFVVGCPRSGTTLLQNLLLNISDSFSMPETHFFEGLPDNYYVAVRSLPGFRKFKYPKILKEKTKRRIIASMKKNSNLNISTELERKLVFGGENDSVKNFFCELMSTYNKSNKKILVEKTPNHIFHTSYLKSLFPDSIIINIVRDPRDVYASYLKFLEKQNKPKRTVAEFSYLWNKSIEFGLNNNLPTIKYEDLIKNPKSFINSVLFNFGLKIETLGSNNYFDIVNSGETWKGNVKLKTDPSNTKKYLNELNKKEITEIEKRCEKGMKIYGYQFHENNKLDILFYLSNSIKWFLVIIKIYRNILKEELKLLIR